MVRPMPTPRPFTAAIRGLGKLYARQENFDKQQQCVQQGWEIARRIQSASLERVFAGDLALLLAAQNKLSEARPYFEDFFRLNETMQQFRHLCAGCLSLLR